MKSLIDGVRTFGTIVVNSTTFPIFLWADGLYNPQDMWLGFLEGYLIVKVCIEFKSTLTSSTHFLTGLEVVLARTSSRTRQQDRGHEERQCLDSQLQVCYPGIHCICGRSGTTVCSVDRDIYSVVY